MKQLAWFISLMAIWLLWTWSLDPQQVIVGITVSICLALILSRLDRDVGSKLCNPIRWMWFDLYLIYFLYYCVRANLDVAYRVLNPNMPIRPGIVKVQTDLRNDVAKTFLANSITLTPGTLTVDMVGQDLFVHWINIVTDDPQERTEIVVKRFERMLRRIFE